MATQCVNTMNNQKNVSEKQEAECPYCGKTFENSIKEGIHRTEEHIQTDQGVSKKSKGNSIIEDWKTKAEA